MIEHDRGGSEKVSSRLLGRDPKEEKELTGGPEGQHLSTANSKCKGLGAKLGMSWNQQGDKCVWSKGLRREAGQEV